MNLEVLVSTMHQTDYSLLKKMNLQSDALIVNQCEKNEFNNLEYKGYKVKFISLSERGIGLSRNTALMRTNADICVLADDDVTYVDDYQNKIITAFKQQPDADMIVFNVPSKNPNRQSKSIKRKGKVRWYNSLKYGTCRMAIKPKSFKKENIYFSLLFGGGAKYGSGEDSLFIFEAIKRGLNVYANPTVIGEVAQDNSTWFKGYTDKYFIDKGALYARLTKCMPNLLALQFVIRHRNKFRKEKKWTEAYKLMLQGIKEIKHE